MNTNFSIANLQEHGILLPTGEINSDKINFISGAATGPLGKTLWEMADLNPDVLMRLHVILSGICEQGRENEAMEILHLLYDISGVEIPEHVDLLSNQPKARSCFLSELLVDMDDVIQELITEE